MHGIKALFFPVKMRVILALAFACLASALFGQKKVVVYVYNTQFSIYDPAEKKPVTAAIINAGDTIRWQWLQGDHTTTAVEGSPEQWNVVINASNTFFERIFTTPGVFEYYCIPHASNMRSTITVLAAGSGACCLPDGSCITSGQGDCEAQGGVYKGVGTLCESITCDQTKNLQALKDNTLYESANGTLSNGKGSHFFAGRSNNGIRRGVLAFDLSSIPTHAVITSVQLKLYCNNNNGSDIVNLHKALQNWGEGNSAATGQETNGATALAGDATWVHTFFPSSLWTNPGADFSALPSASREVSSTGIFAWSSAQLTEDVQHWVSEPAGNFGWVVKCTNENSTDILKRFSSLQNSSPENRPVLTVQYNLPPLGACCLPNGICDLLSPAQCTALGGSYNGAGTSCMDFICPVSLTPFADALPIPAVTQPVTGMPGGEAHYVMSMVEQFQKFHRDLPPTRTWGYNGPTPGPIIQASRGKPVTVVWKNDLRVVETQQLRQTHALFVDTCLHGPNMTKQKPVTVVHLHGGKVSPQSDGHPDSTFLPGQQSPTYHYPNDQPAATLWFHDHALGITRLNVMMGLAGVYILTDEEEQSLDLPRGAYDIPLVIQDKSFSADGSMIYPENAEEHFFGNKILVNGKVWPYLNVHKGKYRFRILNGSNSRVYHLSLANHAVFHVIGTELGLLRQPLSATALTILPGERYEVIMDFSGYATGTEIVLTNDAPAPYPGFPGVGVVPQVMKFVVQAQAGFTNPIPANLASYADIPENESVVDRDFKLYAMQMPACDSSSGHNNHAAGTHTVWTINGKMWDEITENPMEGTTETWRWENTSGIDHPMHLHLVMTRVLDRQPIDANGNPTGPAEPPQAYELGWKDTWNCPTGYRTRTIARFVGFTGRYPYHCHILEHEDHEMMRQFQVVSCRQVSNLQDSGPGSLRFALNCANAGDTITFHPTLAGQSITLHQPLTLSKNTVIYNNLSSPVWIDGRDANNAILVSQGVQAALHQINIRAGQGANGRAILNMGHLRLININLFDTKGATNTLFSAPGSTLTATDQVGLILESQ